MMPKRRRSSSKRKRQQVGQPPQHVAFPSQAQFEAHTTMECKRKAVGRNTVIYLKKIAKLFKACNFITRLKATCFGFLFDWKVNARISMSSNLLTYMVEHQTKGLEFKFGERTIVFTPKEFCLVMGLTYAHSPPSIAEGVSCRLKERYFPQGAVSQASLWSLLESGQIHEDEDSVKLALVLLLESVILGANNTMTVPTKYLCLVDDLGKFNKYPWGSVAYKHLWMGMDVASKIHKRWRTQKTSKYNVYGCTYALQAWALERCPQFAKIAASKDSTPKWPRLLNWFEAKLISWTVLLEHEKSELTFGEELTPTDTENDKYCIKYFSGDGVEEGGEGEEDEALTPFMPMSVPEPTTMSGTISLEALLHLVAMLEAEMKEVKAEMKEAKEENKVVKAELKDINERLYILEVENAKLSSINDDKSDRGGDKEEEGDNEDNNGEEDNNEKSKGDHGEEGRDGDREHDDIVEVMEVEQQHVVEESNLGAHEAHMCMDILNPQRPT